MALGAKRRPNASIPMTSGKKEFIKRDSDPCLNTARAKSIIQVRATPALDNATVRNGQDNKTLAIVVLY